jgi:hypothetical protein
MKKYKALTTFLHDQLGKVHLGDEVEMSDQQAQTPIMFGWVEVVETVAPLTAQQETQRRARRTKAAE